MGGLYAHRNISDTRLKEWVLRWDTEKYVAFARDMLGSSMDDEWLRKQVELVKAVAESSTLESGCPLFDHLLRFMSEAMLHCYFRYDMTTASCGNYYEVLLEAADERTRKRIIEGYEYVQVGGITLEQNGCTFGHIGRMSDLFWHTFYDQYVVSEDGSVEHVRNNETDFTLQIWDESVFQDTYEFDCLVEKILFECEVSLNLSFKRSSFDTWSKSKGSAQTYRLSLDTEKQIEDAPLRYFNFANYTKIARHKAVAYYQVLEFFFLRALREAQLPKPNELEILYYLITTTIDETEVEEWMRQTSSRYEHFAIQKAEYPALIALGPTDSVQALAKRIYAVRCSLIHSKEAPRDVNFIPNLNDAIVEKEVELIKFVAEKVLRKRSAI